jgi:hypothetical protein
MWRFRAKYRVAQNDWRMTNIGGGGASDILGLKSRIAFAQADSFTMINTWAGVAIFRKCF